jgi:hypothetical protein
LVAIDLFLKTLNGKKKELLDDPDALLSRLWPIGDPSFPLLQYIDPYGVTIFGTTQVAQIQKELKMLIQGTTNTKERELLAQALDFAVRASEHPHWFLWFSGD